MPFYGGMNNKDRIRNTDVYLNLETSASMELLGMSRVSEDVPLRNSHDGLDLLHEGGEVEPGLGVDGGELRQLQGA